MKRIFTLPLSHRLNGTYSLMFYIYLACMYEMPTYVQPRGVILRNDWQSVLFDGPGVDHDKDNFLTFHEDDRCTLTLNSNTKTNADGDKPVKRFDISHTRLVDFLKQWEPHARAMQNQTIKTKTRSIQISARAPYVVCHYSCTHPDVFARPYVMGRSLSAVAGQCSAARQVHRPAGCRAHVLGYSPRPRRHRPGSGPPQLPVVLPGSRRDRRWATLSPSS
jgi:hypothetical protein